MWTVRYLDEAAEERQKLPVQEMNAMDHAVDKLTIFGPQLPFPHQSAVRDSNLRELRPRAGRSPWRALYKRFGDTFLIGAVGPEAMVDPQGFRRAVRVAVSRLKDYER